MGIFVGAILTLAGAGLIAFGIFQMRSSGWCGPEESHIVCIRSWVAAVGPIIAGIALLIAIQQYSLARDSSERTLRAYVGVADGGIRLVNLIEGGTGITVQIRLKNSGKTPAYEFTTWIRPPVAAREEPADFGEITPLVQRNGQSIVFADGDVHLNWTVPISPDQLSEIRGGQMRLFIWGGADYTDAYGYRRTFKFHDINGQEINGNSGAWPVKPHAKGYQGN